MASAVATLGITSFILRPERLPGLPGSPNTGLLL